MCLAIPMKLISRTGDAGVVELKGVERKVSLMLFPDAELGQHLLIHAGYAIGSVDEEEAAETVRLLEEMTEAEERMGLRNVADGAPYGTPDGPATGPGPSGQAGPAGPAR